jgi:hypothetical protein
MIKTILLKPLDGDPEGSEREFSPDDFARLEAFGAVSKAGSGGEKQAPVVSNKKAPPVANKTVTS